MTTTDLTPVWYATEETPAGTRWIYPAPSMQPSATPSTFASAGGAVEIRHGYLIADHQVQAVTWQGRGTTKITGWTLKDPTAQSERFPLHVTPGEWTSRCTNGPDDADCSCMWCGSKWSVYESQREDVPGETYTVDFSKAVHLPGAGIDQHPGYTWHGGYGSRELFGPFDHTRPGVLMNVRALLKAAIEQLPNVSKVYDLTDFSVYVDMPWDEPWTEHRPRTNSSGKKLKGTREVTVAKIEKRYEISVPPSIHANSKAEAVAKFEALRDEWLDYFRSAQVKACSSCKGYGYITTEGRA